MAQRAERQRVKYTNRRRERPPFNNRRPVCDRNNCGLLIFSTTVAARQAFAYHSTRQDSAVPKSHSRENAQTAATPMTMLFFTSPRTVAALICISTILFTAGGEANDSTITSTLLSTTIITTSTTTITLGQSTFASTTEVEVTSVTTIPTAAATADMSSGGNAGSGNGVYSGDQFQEAVLSSTNFYRKAYQAQPVTWDDELASFAQDYAQECVWEHSVRRHTHPTPTHPRIR